MKLCSNKDKKLVKCSRKYFELLRRGDDQPVVWRDGRIDERHIDRGMRVFAWIILDATTALQFLDENQQFHSYSRQSHDVRTVQGTEAVETED